MTPDLPLAGPDLERIVAIRRDLHAHPELSLREERTAGVVAAYLRDCGLEVTERVGGWGVVGTLRGRASNRAIAFRADMDALAIAEGTGLPHASRHAGVMHACGHDGHTAMLLGAARALAGRSDVPQDIHFIFQPAEEQHGGARRMIEDGLFARFPCEAIYGLHIESGMALGRFSTCSGPMMAAAGMFRIVMRGAGGHGGAEPHMAADLTMAQAEFVIGLQAVVRRGLPPTQAIVLTIGHVGGGSPDAPNVMPSEMHLAGTARCFDMATCTLLTQRLEAFGQHIAALHGCEVEVALDWEARPLVNPADQTEIIVAAARQIVGTAGVETNFPVTMGAEDFADMMLEKPGAFMFMGNGGEVAATRAPLHTPLFDFNDAAIPYGIAYWVALAGIAGSPGDVACVSPAHLQTAR